MPRKCPPFVELWRDRHGEGPVYFRKDRRPAIPLPFTIASDEFNVAYQAALLARLEPVRERLAPRRGGHHCRPSDSYKQSAEYKGLRETTKAGYTSAG